MKKLLIEDVKVGVTAGGIACGPVGGHVVAEVRMRNQEDGTVKYHSLAEVEGTLNFIESDESTYDFQIKDQCDDEAWEAFLKNISGEFENYPEFFERLEELKEKDDDHFLIWKYLVYMVRADWEETEKMKKVSIGKCLQEIEIPVSDVEEEYLEDMAEESEDE